MKTGAQLISEERKRQIKQEGWDEEHDRQNLFGQLAHAARCYLGHALGLIYGGYKQPRRPLEWPWDEKWWKPSDDPVRDLVKAGALIAAQIDRLQADKKPRRVFSWSSRYPEIKTAITEAEPGKWLFFTNSKYCRWGWDGPGNERIYRFIDPEGGPFITIGTLFLDQEIASIEKDGDQVWIRTKKHEGAVP